MGVAEITKKKKKSISLGNLNAKRDWGYAGDYVNAMWLMLQKEKPSDYVVATGEMYSVREFVEKAFNAADTEIDWVIDNGVESGRCKKTAMMYVLSISSILNRDCIFRKGNQFILETFILLILLLSMEFIMNLRLSILIASFGLGNLAK